MEGGGGGLGNDARGFFAVVASTGSGGSSLSVGCGGECGGGGLLIVSLQLLGIQQARVTECRLSCWWLLVAAGSCVVFDVRIISAEDVLVHVQVEIYARWMQRRWWCLAGVRLEVHQASPSPSFNFVFATLIL